LSPLDANLMKTSDSFSTLFKGDYPQLKAPYVHMQFSYPQIYPQYNGTIHLQPFVFVLILRQIFE